MAKLVKCKTCQADISNTTKHCPSCGGKVKKPFYTRWWFYVIVVFFIFALIGSGGDKTSTETSSPDNPTVAEVKAVEVESEPKVDEVKKEKYEIVGELTEEKDSFAIYISGIIKNNAGKEISYAQITFNLFDKDGNQLGTAMANISNLAKDATWKFKAMGINTDDAVASYKLAEITGF